MARSTTNTYMGPGARSRRAARPVPPDLADGRATAVERPAGPPADSAHLTRAALVALPQLAALALLASAPWSVTIPLTVVLLGGLAVSGVVTLVDRRLR